MPNSRHPQSQESKRSKNLSPPDGSKNDWFFILSGQSISRKESLRAEKLLLSDPDNLSKRLVLLGFYGSRAEQQEAYFKHMLWMVENRPSDYVCAQLGHEHHARELAWTAARIKKASKLWDLQISKHDSNWRVHLNASNFFRFHDKTKSEELLTRAKYLRQNRALASRKLAYHFRSKASAQNQESTKLIQLALAEAKESLKGRDSLGERVGLLIEFTPTAIKAGDLETARKFARRLKYYGTEFYLWKQYAYLYLAWLDLLEKRFRGLRFKLKTLQQSFRRKPTHVACSKSAFAFVNDALAMGEMETARDILKILISAAREPDQKEKQAKLKAWLKTLD